MMKKNVKTIVLLCLVLLLILVRAMENHLFYDPLLAYFKGLHLTQPLPNINTFKLFISYSFRFLLNSFISLAILKTTFYKQVNLKQLTIFFTITFSILIILFFSMLFYHVEMGNLILFYVRRFIIQPIFVLILFPLFYLIKKGYQFTD